MGDSIAAGYGATSQARSYAGLYFGHLRASGVTTLRNVSGPGAWSRDLLETQVPAAVNLIDGASDTRVVTIAIGLNDALLRGCTPPTVGLCELGPNLRAAVHALQAALARDPGGELLQVLEYPTIEGAGNYILLGTDGVVDCAGNGADVGVNDVLRCTALEAGAMPVRVRELTRDQLAEDGHPNDSGHRTIAEAHGGAVELSCVVPRAVGRPLAAAKRAITRAGCAPGRVTRVRARARSGTVVRQSPRPGAALPAGGQVALVVSRGAAS